MKSDGPAACTVVGRFELRRQMCLLRLKTDVHAEATQTVSGTTDVTGFLFHNHTQTPPFRCCS